MTEVKYPDSGGSLITLAKVDERHFVPGITREGWNAVLSLPTRPDDVFICSYPKSGFHWLWEITSMLRSGDATPIKDLMENHILDFLPVDSLPDLEKRPSPRTFTTHRYPAELPKISLEQKCKIIYLIRDLKDICVSYYHHLIKVKGLDYEGEFNDFVQLFLEGKVPFNSWWEYIIQWCDFRKANPDIPFIIIHYEDVKKDPVTEIRKLASFLEVDAGEDLIKDIARNTMFSTMKTVKESLDNPLVVYFKTGKEIMYRKGEVGDWKNSFSESKSKEFDELIQTKLQGVSYQSLLDPQRYACLQ